MKKRIFALLAAALLVLAMPSCAESESGGAVSTDRKETVTDNSLSGKTVIIDAGHGYGDTGCIFPKSGICEKDITPVFALKIKSELEKYGATVFLTHDGNAFPSVSELENTAELLSYDLDLFLRRLLEAHSGRDASEIDETMISFKSGIEEDGRFSIFERCYFANLIAKKENADIFISVHINANENSNKLCGAELYYCTDTFYAADSSRLADKIKNALDNSLGQAECRIFKRDFDNAFVVNKYCDMPSLLVEAGYATNPSDAENLLDAEWQNTFAASLAEGIREYLING